MGDWRLIAFHLLQILEGCKLEAYPDPGTGREPWTIGYGATGPGIKQGTIWTQQQAEDDLWKRISKIGTLLGVYVSVPLTNNQKAALCSLVYNIGTQAFLDSTLLKDLNRGNEAAASEQFLAWRYAAGKPILLDRREKERKVFDAVQDYV